MKELRENWIGDENQAQKEKKENPVNTEIQKSTAAPAEIHAKLPPAVQAAMPAAVPIIKPSGNCTCFTCLKVAGKEMLLHAPRLSMHENRCQEAQRKTWMENVAESDAEISMKQKKQQKEYEEAAKISEEMKMAAQEVAEKKRKAHEKATKITE